MVQRIMLSGNGHKKIEPAIGNNRTVTVACKLPNGLVLELYKFKPARLPRSDGSFNEVEMSERQPRRFIVNGNAVPAGQAGKIGVDGNPVLFAGGYALTPNIPKDFWEEWLEQHEDMSMVQSRLIFAFSKSADVKVEARSMEKLASGLEPMSPPQMDKQGNQVGTLDPRLKTIVGTRKELSIGTATAGD